MQYGEHCPGPRAEGGAMMLQKGFKKTTIVFFSIHGETWSSIISLQKDKTLFFLHFCILFVTLGSFMKLYSIKAFTDHIGYCMTIT